MQKIELKSTITCPVCGFKKEETMPEDACQFFYECENCKTLLKPKKGIVVCFVAMELSNVLRYKKEKIAADI